jgi:flagellar hook-length control protein FliK
VPSGRAVKPISPGLADTAAIASATTGLADPGAGMATAAPALPDTPAGPAIGPAQPAAPANDVAAAPAGAAPPTPAAQLAQAVTSLHVGADGSSHVTIKLDPVELGQLQIRITRAPDGTASVNVAVERPQTLASLQGDLGHLHQALDRAGLPEQRSISLHLAGTDQASSQSFGSGTGGMSQGGFQQGARQERQPGSAFLPDTAGSQILPAMSDLAAPARQPPRSGVNITA